MDEIKETILADALETAISETKENIKLKRLVIIQFCIIIALLFVILIC